MRRLTHAHRPPNNPPAQRRKTWIIADLGDVGLMVMEGVERAVTSLVKAHLDSCQFNDKEKGKRK